MSGTIFSTCVTSTISAQFAALRISALPAAQKRWRNGCNKNTEKKKCGKVEADVEPGFED